MGAIRVKDKDFCLCCNSILDPQQCADRHEMVARKWMQGFGKTAMQQTIIIYLSLQLTYKDFNGSEVNP